MARLVPRARLRVGLHLITFGLVVTYLLSTALRTPGVSIPLYDGWIGNLGYGGCAVLCAWRAVARRAQRAAWAAIALSLALFTAGAVVWTTVVQYWDPVPYPSPSDIFFLAFYPVAYAGVALLIRDAAPGASGGAWFDGIVAALGIATLESQFVIGRVAGANHGDLPTVLTNFAYPIGDLVLVMMLVGLFALHGWRPHRQWWLLALGYVIFAAADSEYVIRVTGDTYVTGTPLDSLWLIGTFLIATAAWLRPPAVRAQVAPARSVVVPVLFLLSSLSVLVVGAEYHAVRHYVLILATSTLLVALAWMAHSYRQLRALATARRQALTDELTGLGNRRMLMRELERHLADPRASVALLVLDLDRLKELNDAFGHSVGDELLAQLGPRLRHVMRREDVLTRFGGDEFAAVFPNADRAFAEEMAHRILRALQAPFMLRDVTVHAGASLGIALAPEHARDPGELLRRADVAMYTAKSRHEGVEVYDPAADTSLDRFELIGDLRSAIANRLLAVHYQPQLDVRTGAVRGVEALVRWPHPARGFISPDVFIGLAEEAQLMRPLTRLVLDLVLAQAAAWDRHGTPVSVSVNLSATNVLDPTIVEDVRRLLKRHAVPPDRLVLEITEGVLLADPDGAVATLTQLRALGVAMSMDDFGTGFSSLAYLRDLPVDELKLDRIFVTNLGTGANARDAEIARSALALGHALGLQVVAEGVEDAATLDVLADLGFDAAQGYYLGRPAPAADLVLHRAPRALTG